MPYLNLADQAIGLKSLPHPRFETQLSMEIAQPELAQIVAGLKALLDAPLSELRVDLPSQWTIFWKVREGESRLLLAHPEVNAWVATLALTREHWQRVLNAFDLQLSGDALILRDTGISKLGPTSRVGNFELTVTVL